VESLFWERHLLRPISGFNIIQSRLLLGFSDHYLLRAMKNMIGMGTATMLHFSLHMKTAFRMQMRQIKR